MRLKGKPRGVPLAQGTALGGFAFDTAPLSAPGQGLPESPRLRGVRGTRAARDSPRRASSAKGTAPPEFSPVPLAGRKCGPALQRRLRRAREGARAGPPVFVFRYLMGAVVLTLGTTFPSERTAPVRNALQPTAGPEAESVWREGRKGSVFFFPLFSMFSWLWLFLRPCLSSPHCRLLPNLAPPC